MTAKLILLSASTALAGLIGLAGVARAGDECTVATKPGTPMAKACKSGGRKEARKTMKEMVKKAKDKGKKFTCDGCHKDLDNYELKPDALKDFKALLKAAS
jgi:hypothetical protein